MNAPLKVAILGMGLMLGSIGCESDPAGPAGAGGDGLDRLVPLEGTIQRPIQDFLLRQGTYCYKDGDLCRLLAPPVANMISFASNEQGLIVSVDYAALASDFIARNSGGRITLPTKIQGEIVEKILPYKQGSLVTIELTGSGVATYATRGDLQNVPLVFGRTVMEVLGGEAPALASISMRIVYRSAMAGAPIPDLVGLIADPAPGEQLLSIAIHAEADGLMAAGSGVPVDTRGHLSIDQPGLTGYDFLSGLKAGMPLSSLIMSPPIMVVVE
jgi:hypothetical protein